MSAWLLLSASLHAKSRTFNEIAATLPSDACLIVGEASNARARLNLSNLASAIYRLGIPVALIRTSMSLANRAKHPRHFRVSGREPSR